VPALAVSVLPKAAVPLIVGIDVFTGLGPAVDTTALVASDDALAWPLLFVAVTRTRIVEPTSASVRT
jgi:hypothetical protein